MASISSCFLTQSLKPSIPFKPSHLYSIPPHYPNKPLLKSQLHSRRHILPSFVRASIDVGPGGGGAVRPGAAVESDKLQADVRKRAMAAIDSCGRRVTIGDVASKAGLKLNEAQRALQALAADTDGFLEVSDEGDVIYVFPKDYRSNLAAKSFRIKIEPLVEKTKSAAEYVIRVSFGTALVASIVLVFTAIIAIASGRSEEDNRGRRGGRSYGSGFNFYINPVDLFWYFDPNYYDRRRQRQREGGMNFIDSVFSFVFGDGDPNQGIEEERWKLIGEYIASKGGVVAAEELAPYLDVYTTETQDNDSYILPVLLRFDGQPEVDDEGNIFYRFPSFQRTATPQRSGRREYVGKKWADAVGGVIKFFKERKWQFSKTNSSERAMAIGLGALNLFGVLVLGAMLRESPGTSNSFITFVSSVFPLLQIYAFSFFAIPFIRWFIVSKTNSDIENRNLARAQRFAALENPDLSLRRKILSARDMAQKTFIGQDRIVYSTDKELSDQDYEAKEWDRRFRELE